MKNSAKGLSLYMSTFGVVCLDVVSIVQSGLDDIKRLNGGNVFFYPNTLKIVSLWSSCLISPKCGHYNRLIWLSEVKHELFGLMSPFPGAVPSYSACV